MTPLIDVVFLIIVFFIILINFSEIHIRTVDLPKADEARQRQDDNVTIVPVIVKAEDSIHLYGQKVQDHNLADILRNALSEPESVTIQIRADENVSYDVIRSLMRALALVNITRIELSALKEQPDPL